MKTGADEDTRDGQMECRGSRTGNIAQAEVRHQQPATSPKLVRDAEVGIWREDQTALLFFFKVGVLERRHEELECIDDKTDAGIVVLRRPPLKVDALLQDVSLLLAFVDDLPEPHQSVWAVATSNLGEADRIELEADAAAIVGVPSPLTEQIIGLAETANVDLVTSGGRHGFLQFCQPG